MIVVPAVDILDGRVVRLRRGVESEAKVYSDDPVEVVSDYARLGAKIVHVVDLDSAIHDDPKKNKKVMDELFSLTSKLRTKTKIQVAGGIRSEPSAKRMARLGASRVVIGSLAFQDPQVARSILASLGPERVVLALDYDDRGFVRTNGWRKNEGESALDAVRRNYAAGFEQFLLTAIVRDGTLEGPDCNTLEQSRHLLDEEAEERGGTGRGGAGRRARIIASGGITTKEDLVKLEQSGVDEGIVGKAFYEGKLDPTEVIRAYSG